MLFRSKPKDGMEDGTAVPNAGNGAPRPPTPGAVSPKEDVPRPEENPDVVVVDARPPPNSPVPALPAIVVDVTEGWPNMKPVFVAAGAAPNPVKVLLAPNAGVVLDKPVLLNRVPALPTVLGLLLPT